MRVAMIFLAATLGGCTTVQTLPKTKHVYITATMARQIDAGVKRSLKDPDSAIFGETAAGLAPEGYHVICGWVNARNGFGGYTGQQMYYGLLQSGRFDVIDFASDSASGYAVNTQCRSAGLTLWS